MPGNNFAPYQSPVDNSGPVFQPPYQNPNQINNPVNYGAGATNMQPDGKLQQ
jgi:hypothetical protein